MKSTITYSDLIDWCGVEGNPAPADRLKESFPAFPATPLEVLHMAHLSLKDRFWTLLRPEIIPEAELHELACKFAEQSLPAWESEYPLDRTPHTVIAAKRAWLRGEISTGQLAAARSFVDPTKYITSLTATKYATWFAAGSGALNARYGARCAACSAARAVEWYTAPCATPTADPVQLKLVEDVLRRIHNQRRSKHDH